MTTLLFLFLRTPPPPPSTLFPYTTLFRSVHQRERQRARVHHRVRPLGRCAGAGHRFRQLQPPGDVRRDRKSTRLNSSHTVISYAVFCLKKKKTLGTSCYRCYVDRLWHRSR